MRPLLPAASKPSEVTKVPPPLLANGSVLDALRKPEYQPFGKGSSVSATRKEDVIDLTDDESRGGDEVSVVSLWSCLYYGYFYILLCVCSSLPVLFVP